MVLAAAGPILPDVLDAAAELADEGVAATVLNITSADRLYADWQSSRLSAHPLGGGASRAQATSNRRSARAGRTRARRW